MSSIIEVDMGGAMNALSASPDWTHIVVAGRDVFKIVKVHRRTASVHSTISKKRNV